MTSGPFWDDSDVLHLDKCLSYRVYKCIYQNSECTLNISLRVKFTSEEEMVEVKKGMYFLVLILLWSRPCSSCLDSLLLSLDLELRSVCTQGISNLGGSVFPLSVKVPAKRSCDF